MQGQPSLEEPSSRSLGTEGSAQINCGAFPEQHEPPPDDSSKGQVYPAREINQHSEISDLQEVWARDIHVGAIGIVWSMADEVCEVTQGVYGVAPTLNRKIARKQEENQMG